MKWRIFSTAAAISLILPVATYAAQSNSSFNLSADRIVAQTPDEPPAEPGKSNKGDRFKKLWEELDLTPEQSQQIEAIHEQSQAEAEPLRQELQQTHEQMRSLLAANASADELRQQHGQIQTLHQQLDDRRFETMLQIREVLTPEQRQQMTQSMERRHERGGRGQ